MIQHDTKTKSGCDFWDELNEYSREDTYQALLRTQDGRCAICGKQQRNPSKRLCLDHNHQTGFIRGLLCSRCNLLVGLIEKDQGEIVKARPLSGKTTPTHTTGSQGVRLHGSRPDMTNGGQFTFHRVFGTFRKPLCPIKL